MYVGRIVAVARTRDGRAAALYRVSSRSFPNREAKALDHSAMIVPRAGFQDDIYKNPYIAYACLRITGDVAVATNGSQTDPIADKIALGVPIRDAMANVLLALDYEKDNYNTPRIAAVVARKSETGFLGIVRKDGLHVREMPIPAGKVFYIATYEIDNVDPNRSGDFDARDAAEGAQFVVRSGVFAAMTLPVTSVCAMETATGFEIAAHTVPAK
jgi:IMP cyclohydrolase